VADAAPPAFAYATRQVRVVFGAGTLRDLPAELEALGARRVVLVTTPGRDASTGALRELLGSRLAAVFAGARAHVPEPVVRDALETVTGAMPDAILALGGGSAIGLGKALARDTALPLAAVPTTYAGSEMTAIWGISAGGEKRTGRDPRVAPRLVVYDAALTYDLPPAVSAASGMNALAHGVEALYAVDANPLSSLLAEDGIRHLAASLPRVVRAPADAPARGEALLGAHLAGRALDLTSMGLHHKLCHVLGGLGLPHAPTHAAILPYAAAFNAPAAPEAMARLAAALGGGGAATGLWNLGRALGMPSLAALGFTAGQIPAVAALVTQGSYPNPRSVTPQDVATLLERALAGRSPV
jgi:maleylacetate reductase